MSEIIRLLLSFIPLFLLPYLAGRAVLGKKLIFSAKWWFGMIVIGMTMMIGHALSFKQNQVFLILTVLFLLCSIKISLSLENFSLFKQSRNFFNQLLSLSIVYLPLIIILGFGYVTILVQPVATSDALGIWLNKARNFYYWIPLKEMPHNYTLKYPNLGPIYEMLIMKFSGGFYEMFGRLLFPTLYFFWIITFFSFGGKTYLWLKKLLIIMIGLLFFDDFAFTSGYQDGFLALTASMSAIYFCQILGLKLTRKDLVIKDNLIFFLAFFLAGSLSLIKSEGTFLGIILVVSAMSALFFGEKLAVLKNQFKKIVVYLLGFLIIISLWPILLKINHLSSWPPQEAFTNEAFLDLFKNWGRLALISKYLISNLNQNLFILAISSLLSLTTVVLIPKLRKKIFFLWFVIINHSLFIMLIFLTTRLPLEWHLSTAFSRLMFQHYYLYPILIFLSFTSLTGWLIETLKTKNP